MITKTTMVFQSNTCCRSKQSVALASRQRRVCNWTVGLVLVVVALTSGCDLFRKGEAKFRQIAARRPPSSFMKRFDSPVRVIREPAGTATSASAESWPRDVPQFRQMSARYALDFPLPGTAGQRASVFGPHSSSPFHPTYSGPRARGPSYWAAWKPTVFRSPGSVSIRNTDGSAAMQVADAPLPPVAVRVTLQYPDPQGTARVLALTQLTWDMPRADQFSQPPLRETRAARLPLVDLEPFFEGRVRNLSTDDRQYRDIRVDLVLDGEDHSTGRYVSHATLVDLARHIWKLGDSANSPPPSSTSVTP